MDGVELLQASLFGKDQDLPIQLLDRLVVFRDLDCVAGLQNGDFFSFSVTLRIGLARHGLVESPHLSGCGLLVAREMSDWGGCVGGFSESG